MLKVTVGTVVVGVGPNHIFSAEVEEKPGMALVAGAAKAGTIGNKVLHEGGNAVDAIVAAALAAAVGIPNGCGIGGYGGHMVIYLAKDKKVTSIDFNSTAPAAAKADMFAPHPDQVVPGGVNEHGWLAAGVPGTLAGLQLALDRYGSRSFQQVVGPAIELAAEGFAVSEGLSRAIRAVAGHLRKDAGSRNLLFREGEPLRVGTIFRNPEMGRMLARLAEENSVESFYRGDIGTRIAEAFQKNGGLVTAKDMAAYRAREVDVLSFVWRGLTVRTAPLTAGGLTVLQALSILKACHWHQLEGMARTHALIEALRLAWHDRLKFLGDPEKTVVPVERLLSEEYTERLAAQVSSAVENAKPIPLRTNARADSGTVHLNSADRFGNVVALTLTHGATFGACVTVKGLGLTLGHGMSRFDPDPDHPNAPGPGKRPLHNMCPTLVFKADQPLLALGATGGRRIPSTLYSVLANYVGLGLSPRQAVTAPRVHSEGGLDVTLDRDWPEAELAHLNKMGFNAKNGPGAIIQALAREDGTWHAAAR